MAASTMQHGFHPGEFEVQSRLGFHPDHNPMTSANPTGLTAQAARMLQIAPLIALGTVDKETGRIWATIWGGHDEMAQAVNADTMVIRTAVDASHDPVLQILLGQARSTGELVRATNSSQLVAGLAINLEHRRRIKLAGKFVAGAVGTAEGFEGAQPDAQLVLSIEQSLGNCPKYLNKWHISQHARGTRDSTLACKSRMLPQAAVDLLRRSDLFFIASTYGSTDMDCNHRGGPPGFVRVKQTDDATEIYWPDYSGNRYYHTMGNLYTDPRAGLVFPDFETGDVVYVSGNAELLFGKDAAAALPRSHLAVKITVEDARYVKSGLPFRGTRGESSPYNPKPRPLATEDASQIASKGEAQTEATLISRIRLSPTVNQYTFDLADQAGKPATANWQRGGWVALDFSKELDLGYSHMREDDPRSLNDDWIRTFTISSSSSAEGWSSQIQITARTVGAVTGVLSNWKLNSRAIPFNNIKIVGFGGGEMAIRQEAGKVSGIVAAGVGITPILAQLDLPEIDLSRIRILWAVRDEDDGLVQDVVARAAKLAAATSYKLKPGWLSVYTSRKADGAKAQGQDDESVVRYDRRLEKQDIVGLFESKQVAWSPRWLLCAPEALQQQFQSWLQDAGASAGQEVEVVTESFKF